MNDIVTLILLSAIFVSILIYMTKELQAMTRDDRVVLVSSKINQIKNPFLKAIDKYVSNPQELNFVEIGAGYAKISELAAKDFSWKSVLAVEIDTLVVFWNRLKKRFRKTAITYIKSDIFEFIIPKNSVVYCYMSVPVINRLYKEQAFEGCLVLSLSFAIKGLEPVDEYIIKGFQKKLYVYDFR
jgi:tRNA G46 methylase TrmB